MNGICHIVGAGRFDPALLSQIEKDDYLIAADGGYAYLKQSHIKPDLFIGDGDSLGYVPKEAPSVTLPVEKDDTDMIAACRIGLERGYRRFHLYGALGGNRFSHSLANLQTLFFLRDRGAEGILWDPYCTVRLLKAGRNALPSDEGTFSLFAVEAPCEIAIENAAYPLPRSPLDPHFPLGVSNRGDRNTVIELFCGTALLVTEP